MRKPQRAERAGALRRGAGLRQPGGGQPPRNQSGHEAGAGGQGHCRAPQRRGRAGGAYWQSVSGSGLY